jgi:DNA-binding NtrC family response regulator
VRLEKIALLDSTALLTGESGTGKTTVARMIHERSARKKMPFVAVNCASLPSELIDAELFGHARGSFTGAVSDRPGRADAADGGTLFLDEIGDLPLELQPKLLTFLQDRTFHRIGDNLPRSVDVRIIAATHRDLRELCRKGVFREDLYFRLNVLGLTVPPLRDRPHDIIDMTAEILNRICRQRLSAPFELEPAAAEALQQYHWPGNVRELENVLENASAFCEDHQIRLTDLNLSDSPGAHHVPTLTLAGKTLAEIERLAILETLSHCEGNKAQAARVLGISEKSIYNKMRRHGLHPA